MRAWAEETPLYDLLAAEPAVTERLPDAQLRVLFEPSYHLRYVDEAFRRVGLLPSESPVANRRPREGAAADRAAVPGA